MQRAAALAAFVSLAAFVPLAALGVATAGSARAEGPLAPAPEGAGTPGTESAAGGSASCSAHVSALVQRHYEAVEDFSAEFQQTTRSALFGSSGLAASDVSRGEVVLAKPGKMRWQYVHPEASLVVSDGATLWIYSESLKEAQRLPMTDGYLTGAALSFLLGEGNLLETFHVKADSCEGPRVELELLPLEPASYQRLGLTVLLETGQVVATRVIDLFGNETSISFENVRQNQQPADAVFEFEPGPGVSVVEISSP